MASGRAALTCGKAMRRLSDRQPEAAKEYAMKASAQDQQDKDDQGP